MGWTVDEIFEWVGLQPIASASLAQVHRAKLRTGEEATLKLQHPRVVTVIALDR